MTTDPVLGLLGLALRAGKLACGDGLSCELCETGKARVVFLASDAGENTAKKAGGYAKTANIPCITLPYDKQTVGSALGRDSCAVCAVSDIGMANAAVKKLAAQNQDLAEQAALLHKKNERIQKRRGIKKKKTVSVTNGGNTDGKTNTTMEVSANGD